MYATFHSTAYQFVSVAKQYRMHVNVSVSLSLFLCLCVYTVQLLVLLFLTKTVAHHPNNVIQFSNGKCSSMHIGLLESIVSSLQKRVFYLWKLRPNGKQNSKENDLNNSVAFSFKHLLDQFHMEVLLLETTKSTFSLINTSLALNALNTVKVYAKIFAAFLKFPIEMNERTFQRLIKKHRTNCLCDCMRMYYNELKENNKHSFQLKPGNSFNVNDIFSSPLFKQ